ncbi:hypothetical protein N0V82_003917 [Gnomoniopsis sp. IMI 355080]|nr:hypothetical protein N0V82_003917 [Gnomoniopsis sp. IMI 355080]
MAPKRISLIRAIDDSIINGPVPLQPFVPKSANIFPKMVSLISNTAWELWEFEAFSADGSTALGVSLYRDARGIDKGGFHAEVNALWPDGRKWGETLYFHESMITDENDEDSGTEGGCVQGVWRTLEEDRDPAAQASLSAGSITFTTAADLSSVSVCFLVPSLVTGTLELRCLGGDHRCYRPADPDAALLYPSVYYMFPMGPLVSDADLVFHISDSDEGRRRLIVKSQDGARGGMVRGWSTKAWPDFMNDAYYTVANVGPYSLQLLRVVGSAAAEHKSYVSARLYRGDDLACAANGICDDKHQTADPPDVSTTQGVLITLDRVIQQTQDETTVEKVFPRMGQDESGIAGAFCDRNIGYVIEFVSWKQQKRWRFDVRHKRAWWSEPTSAPGPQATGKSGWIERIVGGSADEVFEGTGVGGQLQIPVP